jgi:hypothetical protein
VGGAPECAGAARRQITPITEATVSGDIIGPWKKPVRVSARGAVRFMDGIAQQSRHGGGAVRRVLPKTGATRFLAKPSNAHRKVMS